MRIRPLNWTRLATKDVLETFRGVMVRNKTSKQKDFLKGIMIQTTVGGVHGNFEKKKRYIVETCILL